MEPIVLTIDMPGATAKQAKPVARSAAKDHEWVLEQLAVAGAPFASAVLHPYTVSVTWGRGRVWTTPVEPPIATRITRPSLVAMYEKIVADVASRAVYDGPAGELCMICLEPFAAGDAVRVFLCGHMYHRMCADRWLDVNPTCPVDRQPVP